MMVDGAVGVICHGGVGGDVSCGALICGGGGDPAIDVYIYL